VSNYNTSANSLAANTYTATITFIDTDTGQTDQTLTATLTVNKLPLQVTPASNIAASGTQGGPFSPSSFSYTLSAASGSVKYSISGVPNWLTASPTSGTVTTKATSVTFKINTSAADKLSASTYVSSINFNNNTNTQVTTRVATLTVTPKEYTIKVSASPSADGTVSGGGTFCGGHFGNGDSHAQQRLHVCPLDRERARGQHVRELHVHAQCQRHPGR
jgi:hypothetical protein